MLPATGNAFAQSDLVDARAHAWMAPPEHDHWPRWVAIGGLMVGLLTLVSMAACRRGVPILDTAPSPAQVDGTIRGTVRGPEGTSPADGRIIEVVNVDTGEMQRVTTNNAGGFSCKLKPGKYRVELTLRGGESLLRQPGIIDLHRSDVDTHADFVLGTVRISRPRGPAYRIDDGLGSPIA